MTPDRPREADLPGRVPRRYVGAPTTNTPQPNRPFKPDPAWNKLLLLVGAAVVVAAILIVPGILNRGGENPVAAAAQATDDAPGVRVAFSGSSAGPEALTVSGKGLLNGDTNRASIELTASGSTGSGVDSFTFNEIVDAGDIYIHSPQLGDVFGGSAPWLLMRSEVFGDLFQADVTGMGAGMSSPTQQLDALKDASYEVMGVGREQLNGVETTHYTAVIDIGKLTDQIKGEVSGEFEDLIERSMEQVSSATVDVWIDGEGLLRRETSRASMGALGSFTMTMDFSHYGIHPEIQVPPSSQVFDVTPLMERALDELGG
jgi:hypothetical protein